MPKTKPIKRTTNTILKPCKIDYAPLLKVLLDGYEKWEAEQSTNYAMGVNQRI